MKRTLILALYLMSHGTLETAATTKPADPSTDEEQRKTELQNGLCADWELSCAYLVQFEPSSFKFAVDGDGDGKIDLLTNAPNRAVKLTRFSTDCV